MVTLHPQVQKKTSSQVGTWVYVSQQANILRNAQVY